MTQTPPPARQEIAPKTFILLSLIESAFVIAGMGMFFLTEQVLWMIGSALVGSLPLLWVLTRSLRGKAPAARSSIVEGGDRR